MLKLALRQWSARTGKPQQDAARMIGVTPQTVISWKMGRSTPQPRHIKALADLLGLDPVDVLNEFEGVA
jgi:DNA-binding XRE family transcriptional regulator